MSEEVTLSAALTKRGAACARLMRDVVDEMWRVEAWERAAEDPELRRWRDLYDRRAQRAPSRMGRVPPPPTGGLLRLLLGAAWWKTFDAHTFTVEPVQREIDPLHHYIGHIRAGDARTRLMGSIEELRPTIFAHVMAYILRAITADEIKVAAYSGIELVELPANLLAGRRWTLGRDATLVIYTPDGGQFGYDRATIEPPDRVAPTEKESPRAALPVGPGRAPGLNYREKDKVLHDQMRKLIEGGKAKGPKDAALSVVGLAEGAGTLETKVKRLAGGYKQGGRSGR